MFGHKVFSRTPGCRMQVVRLPDWKLLVYITVPFTAYIGLLATVQKVDPMRPSSSVQSRGEGLRDEISQYCGTGRTGSIILGICGGLLVRIPLFVTVPRSK